MDHQLALIQMDLFDIGALLASPDGEKRFPGAPPARVGEIEGAIDSMESELSPLRSFILPGGSPGAAALHLARTTCRRAERRVIGIGDDSERTRAAIVYLNRLSDFLFVAARFANLRAGVEDVPWKR
jgi:cob(I)alamin adenosyltransferase